MAQELGCIKASEELGVPNGTLSVWVTASKRGYIDLVKGSLTPESGLTIAGELKKCREQIKIQEKETARLHKENEFLEEASRFFAQSRKNGV